MTRPRVLILRAPGTNCDEETAFAFEAAGAIAERLHVRRLLEQPRLLMNFQILCLPGGFSYGDDLAAGRILGNLVRNQLADLLQEFRDSDRLMLGICNGFQILLKTGLLLPDDPNSGSLATLAWNASGHFEDRWVELVATSEKSVFFRGATSMCLPVAHAEGRFVARDSGVLDRLERNGQLVLRYAGPSNAAGEVAYPFNPNGAARNVAGICDETGRVCGIMPHPERHVDALQHPRWTRRRWSGEAAGMSNQAPNTATAELASAGDGLVVFRNAVRYFE